jgi:hypothetical protein
MTLKKSVIPKFRKYFYHKSGLKDADVTLFGFIDNNLNKILYEQGLNFLNFKVFWTLKFDLMKQFFMLDFC